MAGGCIPLSVMSRLIRRPFNFVRRKLSPRAEAAIAAAIDMDDDGSGEGPQTTLKTERCLAWEYDWPDEPPQPANGLPLGNFRGSAIPSGIPERKLNYADGDLIPDRDPAPAAPVRSGFVPQRAPMVNRTSVRWPKLKHVPLLSPPYAYNDVAKGVKYVDDPALLFTKYEVTIQKVITRRYIKLDTPSIKRHFSDEKKVQLALPFLGRDEEDNKRFASRVNEWKARSLIWVCVKDEATNQAIFYSHVGKLDRFHHSSFTCGGEVIGAGEWIVEDGHLKKISANSGHYRPPIEYLYRAVLFMSNAWRNDTTVLLWNVSRNDYEEVPVEKFRALSSNGGNWKAHPNSV